MIEKALAISLMITAIHVSMLPGMIFHKLRLFLEKHLPECLHKPLFSCLICMGGFYSLLLHSLMHGLSIEMLPIMLITIGINTLISIHISNLYE